MNGEFRPIEETIEGISPRTGTYPDPVPFDIDGYFNEWNLTQPREKMGENRDNFIKVNHSWTRPFLAFGYNTMAALNRGIAHTFAHWDAVSDYIEISGMGKKEGLLEKFAQIAEKDADKWKKRVDEVGISFIEELVSEAVGGFVPGVTQFVIDVGSFLTFPYMAGAAKAYKRGEDPFSAGIIEAARTGTLATIFRMMAPLKKYLQASTMGTIFGLQEMEGAPEGEKAKAFAKGAGIGLVYSLSSPGGRFGLNEIKKNLEPELAKVKELAEVGEKVLVSERGAIGKKREPIEKKPESGKIEPVTGKKGKGEIPTVETPKPEGGRDYQLSHRPNEEGPQACDLLSTDLAPKDIYDRPDYYTGDPKSLAFKESINVLKKIRGKPEATVTIYRASPQKELNPGDWVTFSKSYAQLESRTENVPVYSFQVKAKDIRWAGDTLEEFGYFPEKLSLPKPSPPAGEAGAIISPRIPSVEEPLTRPRKFLKTVEEATETAPEIKERLEKMPEEAKDYYVQPNKESLEKADVRIQVEGIDKTVDYALSKEPLSAEKGATFIRLMENFQKQGDYDRAIQMIESYDIQLREAGRFVQAASIWNKLSPPGFVRWAEKQLKTTESKYGWVDTIFGRKPENFTFSKEEKTQIFEKMNEINKMPEGIEKTDATLEMIDFVAQKVPPSVNELIDAYRYQNMLSSPRTHMRNIGENIFNTFMTRPIDLTTRGAYDWTKSVLFGKDREAYISDVPVYVKTSINAVPNALKAFAKTWSMESGTTIGKPELGIEVKTEFHRARAKQMPSWLTVIPRFMEASDKFNSALIGAGEFAIQKQRGATDAEAYERASQLGEKYLYRDKLDPSSPDISYFSKALESMGKIVEESRRLPGIGNLSKWYVPFIKTPINKAVQMVEHSPLGLARAKFDNEAMAKIIAGSMFTGFGAIFAIEGNTTWAPPSDKKEKELFYATGRKPFSIRIGDRWVPLWYLGPFALAFGIPAAVKYYVYDQKQSMTKDAYEKLIETAEGLARFIGSQTSSQSLGALFSALSGDIDYTLTSQTAFTVEQIIPGQSFVRYVNTIIDPVYRKPKGFIENIEKDLPFLSKKLEERMTPLFEPSVREAHNYFIHYDIGTTKELYEAIYPLQRYQLRQEHLQNKVDELTRKVRKGEMTPEDSMKEMIELLKVPQKSLEQLGKELEKTKE